MKYWIGVVSREHALDGVKEGVVQIGHGKRRPLALLNKGDQFIYYSPVNKIGDKQPLQAFTTLGEIADDDIYQIKVSESFQPYRRKINYTKVKDAPIRPLIESLDFIKNKKSWGYTFRFGLVEINESDFEIIKAEMSAE